VPTSRTKNPNTIKQDVAKLKQFVMKEAEWQRKITNRVKVLSRKAGLPIPPTDLPPPPKPPFK
jgi:hypothetical protein